MAEPGAEEKRGASVKASPSSLLDVLHELHRRSTGQMVLFAFIFVVTTWYNWTADYFQMHGSKTGEQCKLMGPMYNLSVKLFLGWVSATVVFLARGVRQVYFSQIVHERLQRRIPDDIPILTSGIAMLIGLLLAIASHGVLLMDWSVWLNLGFNQGVVTMLFAQVFRDRSESDDVKQL